MKGCFVPVTPQGKLPDAAFIAHGLLGAVLLSGVPNGDGQARIQKRLFPHPGVQRLVIINDSIKNLRIRLERHLRAGSVCGAYNFHLLGDGPPGEFHLIDLTVLVHPYRKPYGQGIHHRCAHAVEAAGDLIAAAAEFSAGVEDCIDHLQGRPAGLGLNVHGNAPAVVGDGDGLPRIDGDRNVLAIPGQGLVNGIVHDLIDQVVQTGDGGGADIHTWPFPDRFQPFQHLDLGSVIFRLDSCISQLVGHKRTSFSKL